MKKIASLMAVLTAAAALAVPAMARDRDDSNCAPYENYGAYNTYNAYQAYGTYGYPVTGRVTVIRHDDHDRNDNRDRGRVANDHRDAGRNRGENGRR